MFTMMEDRFDDISPVSNSENKIITVVFSKGSQRFWFSNGTQHRLSA
jgi:hypothetical protein